MVNDYVKERAICPSCGAASFNTLYQCSFLKPPIHDYLKNFYGDRHRINFDHMKDTDYILEECQACGLIFQKYVPKGTLLEDLYYEPSLTAFDKTFFDRTSSHDYCARVVELMMSLTKYTGKAPKQTKVYELGFGWGVWATIGLSLGYQMYGSELVESKIQLATSRGINVIALEDVPNHRFDIINSNWVFEHLVEPGEIFRTLRKGLADDGILRVAVPLEDDMKKRLKRNDWNAPKGSRWSLNSVHPLEHINCFRRSSLDKLAASCGLRPIRIPIRDQFMMVSLGSPRQSLKSLLRPFYHNYHSRYDVRYYTIAS